MLPLAQWCYNGDPQKPLKTFLTYFHVWKHTEIIQASSTSEPKIQTTLSFVVWSNFEHQLRICCSLNETQSRKETKSIWGKGLILRWKFQISPLVSSTLLRTS